MNDKIDQSKPKRANSGRNNSAKSGVSMIGKSIEIAGDIKGSEDVIINGNVEGDISFSDNNITIGKDGQINANMTGKNITVEGEVKGELQAHAQITIRPSGKVTGDLRAPRVVLDDGCAFKGSVDMDEIRTSDNRNSKLHLTSGGQSREHPLKSLKK